MPDEKDPPPVYGYVFGRLTQRERTELMRRALDDQEIFNALWDACDDHELLQDPEVRKELLASLAAEAVSKPSPWTAARQALIGPFGRFALAGAAAACLAIFILHGLKKPIEQQILTLVTNPSSNMADYFKLPKHNPAGLNLDLHRTPAVFHPGDIVRATVQLKSSAAVFALRRGPAGEVRLVFPPDPATLADRNPGEIAISFDPVPPTEDVTATRHYILRVIALRPGIDLRSQSVDWAKLAPDSYSVVEVSYDVVP
ncbi:hypothetical protein SBA3_110007 [Candidatus Sulfopaludibacter sp. SbA3]|nr:hypothetical protein SBA3_110007 [Candidatus Sulfopaludibacter sp. SbA3]